MPFRIHSRSTWVPVATLRRCFAEGSAMTVLSFTARFRKHEFQIHLTTADPSLGQVASAIASATGAEEDTIKLVIPGKKGQMLRPTANPSVSATTAGKLARVALPAYQLLVPFSKQIHLLTNVCPMCRCTVRNETRGICKHSAGGSASSQQQRPSWAC